MRRLSALAVVLLLAACAAPPPTAVGTHVTAALADEGAARQHCLMLLRPHIPAGTPLLESKLASLPDAQNGDKVLRLPYAYGTTGVKVDARCNYRVLEGGAWQFSRLILTPRYPQPK